MAAQGPIGEDVSWWSAAPGLRIRVGRNRRVTSRSVRSAAMRSLHIAAAAFICALTATACGSSNSASSGTGSSDPIAIQFADCMRSHGVPHFPDPGQGSGLSAQDSPQSPAFKSASTTCDKLQPGGNTPPPKPSKSRQLAMMRFAKCMREHGVSNFPDPTLSLPPGNVSAIDVGGIFFVLPPGLDFQSPAVKQARTACGTIGGRRRSRRAVLAGGDRVSCQRRPDRPRRSKSVPPRGSGWNAGAASTPPTRISSDS